MNNCDCKPKYVPGALRTPRPKLCPYQGPAPLPNAKPTPELCACKPTEITLRTVVLPASLGTEAEGEPYAPKPGAYYNTVVKYQSTGAIFIYDSNGVYTEVLVPGEVDVEEVVETLQQQMAELYTPAKIGYYVDSVEELDSLSPNVVPAGQMVQVTKDATHDGVDSLYYYNTASGQWTYAYAATPYYTKDFVDSVTEALQTNINTEVEAREAAINAEQSAREQADNEFHQEIANLNTRIEDIVNSPDVRYIVDTYADLEAIDKSTIGDQDYARVLQDETHEDASTYYQFNKTAGEWNYVGQTGPYYTKEQIDSMIGNIDSILDEINGEVPGGSN